jgi:hypothetical protein
LEAFDELDFEALIRGWRFYFLVLVLKKLNVLSIAVYLMNNIIISARHISIDFIRKEQII